MGKIALWFAMFLAMPILTACSANTQLPALPVVQQQLVGAPVYIQIFKEERTLELYTKIGDQFRLAKSFRICSFSGGLGPKRQQGDFKSPEGFYSIDVRHLKPDSQYYRAINIGFPNDYDKAQGYSGAYLMIHGECKSIGCYAMTNTAMGEIYRYVAAAFAYGQSRIDISIYPFRMTKQNLQRHRSSSYIAFWRQLEPGYNYFVKNQQPPRMAVANGQYVLNRPLMSNNTMAQYTSAMSPPHLLTQSQPFTKVK
ncbi:putative conserved protein [Serratia symbiotica str. Tucson]|uniref:Putative conserved protein n=1 Tax=Serratia symbiotica str. Tucson TaxID=914128 RepID=E9CNQ5_9GAMM|nr:peptidoglycan meso-diaminopimelic acid protein amidase [Serratia symbiotica]EFW11836.1 putative conserved protein [Serratia symbiotica str. Tucson]